MIKVSIVIVCMNNLKNLYLCLDSIKKYTTNVSYETLVVAYLFSKDNIEKLKTDYSWVTIIESNEIRGFSENNNLALRMAKGKYCFVLNDDTEFVSPIVEELVETIEKLPEDVAVISPPTYYPDGSIQSCGRPRIDAFHYILSIFNLWNEQKAKSRYTYKTGVFKTYNIVGAAFLIRTEIFKQVGWFDERYFFTPEDIALSTKLNKMGYSCYVNANLKLIHYEGKSRNVSMIYAAIKPASTRGNLIFYSKGKTPLYILLSLINLVKSIFAFHYHLVKSIGKAKPNHDYALMIGYRNCFEACITKTTPKELFIKYYRKL